MPTKRAQSTGITKEKHWYKDAIIYELHVRAFCDSNGDGIGDFQGLTEKLGYLQDLGVTAIWILPFYPSPLKDDGYDIADYYSIHPNYGTLKDFKNFLDEAHARELRVITELVVNHTSDQHPWFQKSRRAAPDSHWRGFYVWSPTPEPYKSARIIFRDFEHSNWAWDPVAKAYFWHRFYSHQPDLNYDNPAVHKEILRVLDFWFDMGVDGLRLDAVPYLFERENTSCENLPETHQFLKKLRAHVDQKYGDRMLLAEANQWPEDAVTYFGGGSGDECHMAFHFPLMPRMFMAVRMEDRVPVVDILEQTPAIPDTSQWALFLRNHDELTLEMVTDEERDYMYRVYANDTRARINLGIRRRLAPLLGNDRKRIELLHMLLFSLPGTPVLYYGDEIGMGDNVYLGDRNGVRTPMQWSSDRNAGFSRATPQALYLPIVLDPEYHYEAVNVDVQQHNPHSLYWWVKRAITLRKRYPAFGRGTLEFLPVDNRKVLAFVRKWEDQVILVVANLSRFTQPAELDLSRFEGYVPVEIFGQAALPLITAHPYFLTLGPHTALWFLLETAAVRKMRQHSGGAAEIQAASGDWPALLEGAGRARLEAALLHYITNRRWFSQAAPKAVRIREAIPLASEAGQSRLLVVSVDSMDAEPQDAVVPVAMTTGAEAALLERDSPQLVIARLQSAEGADAGLLYEAVADCKFCAELLRVFSRQKPFKAGGGELKAVARAELRSTAAEPSGLAPQVRRADEHHSTIVYGNRFFLKLFRRLEAGTNPELQLVRFLNEKNFPHVPTMLGWIEFRRKNGESITIASIRGFLPEARDAKVYFVETVTRYFERVRALGDAMQSTPETAGTLVEMAAAAAPESVLRLIGTPIELARILGQRTAEMHLALVSPEPDDKEFAPEPFTPFYQRSLFQSLRNNIVSNLRLLRRNLDRVPGHLAPLAAQVAGLENEAIKMVQPVNSTAIRAQRIRCHGSYHLAQLLFTGKDFLVVNFDGRTFRSFGERRIKHCGFHDVASMLRSFMKVAAAAISQQVSVGTIRAEDVPSLEPWAIFWFRWTGATFLKAYLEGIGHTGLLPSNVNEKSALLLASLIGGLFNDLGYAITNHPDRLALPLRSILHVVGQQSSTSPTVIDKGT